MGPRSRYLIFSLNSFAGAMIALWIAFSLGLPRPFWAMLTVYITAQPLTGALRSKALYRVLGTATGGAAAVVIVPTFVNAPLLMTLMMASWIGFCLYLSLLDRTPRAYLFMLAGYTTAIIGFPSVTAPSAVFETALARVEEITLGIVCATVVHTIFFPRDVGQVLNARIAVFLTDAQAWVADALADRRTSEEREDRRRLASDVTELHVTSSHLPFDTSHLALRIRTVRTLENRLAYLLPLITALEDRISALPIKDSNLTTLLSDVTVWVESPDASGETSETLQARCREMTPVIAGQVDWPALLRTSLLVRLEELIQALQDSRDLARFIAGETAASARTDALLAMPRQRRLHLDHGMAALSALALAAAVISCCALWIATGWPEGAVAATMAAVFCSFYAAQDDPSPAIVGFLVWSLAALPLAALYLFAILPAIDGFPMLVLALAPAMLLIGYLQANPAWTPRGTALLIGFAGALGLQASFSADLPSFLNGNLAQIVGIAIALAATRLLRSVGAGWAARRILRRGWRDVAALARRRRPIANDAWIAAMLDRVGLVQARIALAEPEETVDAYDALTDMRIGLNVLDLEGAARAGAGGRRAIFDAALDGVASTFERRTAKADAAPEGGLLHTIDDAITHLAATPGERDSTVRGFAALTGLRRNLFPSAPPYAPPESAAA
jgi:uncharacterized membrane protein YccC